jgi:hypothetical protein
MDANRYLADLEALFAGRRVVCVGATVRSLTPTVRQLRNLGVGQVMVVGLQGEGVGEALADNEAVVFTAQIEAGAAATSMDLIRAEEAYKRSPPAELKAALAAFDPDCRAVVVGQFVNTEPHLDGRPFLAYRKPDWLKLEDKTVIDSFFDRAGVDRATSESVACDVDELRRAARWQDRGAGTVWSGDTREGFNGGAEYVRWVSAEGHFADAVDFFRQRCDRVRVMPFLPGVPCSIHGVVLDDGVAALRPVEMMTLVRTQPRAGESLFTYRGCASFYEPSVSARQSMREAARRVGNQLRKEVAFRGCFTLDGVVGPNGFLPTEVNPRQGAGLFAMLGKLTTLPVGLLMDLIAGGHPTSFSAEQLESDLCEFADANPGGGTWAMVTSPVPEHSGTKLAFDGDRFRWAGSGDRATAALWSGPRGTTGFVRAVFEHPAVPAGPSVAPLAAAFWTFIDTEFGTGVGPLSPA